MLQQHSYLWHYLWVGPRIFLLILALLLLTRRRDLARQFPAFCAFIILSAISHIALYVADVSPSISAETFWLVDWAGLLIDGVLKFALIAEIFAHVFGSYASVARLGKILIRALGVVLTLTAAVTAAYAPQSKFGIISGAHLLEQTTYLIESGLLVFIFLFAAYFGLRLSRPVFGIALGLAVSACVHLATWALVANVFLSDQGHARVDFLNMTTYHIGVLIWCYYLLVPGRATKPKDSPKDLSAGPPTTPTLENVQDLNRELERLIHQ